MRRKWMVAALAGSAALAAAGLIFLPARTPAGPGGPRRQRPRAGATTDRSGGAVLEWGGLLPARGAGGGGGARRPVLPGAGRQRPAQEHGAARPRRRPRRRRLLRQRRARRAHPALLRAGPDAE